MPLTKNLLFKLIPLLEPADDFESTNMDYPTYSANSTAGKVLMALINYSLRNARLINYKNKDCKWSKEVKGKFEQTLKKGIIDGYVLQGMYFRNFLYLDKTWLLNQVYEIPTTNSDCRKAFFGGYLFSNPPYDKNIFKTLTPLYEMSIDENESSEMIARNLATYLFWGFDKPTNKNSLIRRVVQNENKDQIEQLIHFIWVQRGYVLTIPTARERKNFTARLLAVWRLIYYKFNDQQDEKSHKLISSLSRLSVHFQKLNSQLYELLLPSMKVIHKGHNHYSMLEEFNRLLKSEKNHTVATFLGQLISEIPVKPFLSSLEEKELLPLVKILYEFKHNEKIKELADSICNNYAKDGYEFLKELYYENNS
nr:hypothetical protein [Bacteroidota bacterium]